VILSEGTKPKALIAGLQSGDIDLASYLDSLETHFELSEPDVLAFLQEKKRFSRMMRNARALGRSGSNNKELYGIPVGVKDIFQVDGFKTRAGSQLPTKYLQGKEAESVRRLKKAGALIMGKTVTTEFAYFAPGPTRNPHNLEHTPGGSSSGSAAAVAAGMMPLALGTQTIGSVIRPAAFCGVVGYKPSYGRISTKGVIPLSPSLDHVGTFARSVWMTAKAAEILVDNWRKDEEENTRPILGIPDGEYLKNADEEMLKHFWEVVDLMKQIGYTVRRQDLLPHYENIIEQHNLILDAEAAQVHREWYRFHSEKYNERTLEMIERGMLISKSALKEAKAAATYFGHSVSTVMDINHIDLWVSPAAPGAAPKGLDSTGSPVMNLPWTQAGLPTLGLPSGKTKKGLPLGIQFVADRGKDEELLAWGLEIENVLEKKTL
jgi:Asp-tRNA(Asn)/Glu-tRNA(Gln) amidotransferase A subunit family amidase